MTDFIPHCLSEDTIESILQLPEVITAKDKLNNKLHGTIQFTIPLTPSIQSYLHESMGIDLTGVDTLPLRWIKGDTYPHIDKGAACFEKTHLVYLTDSPGQLIIDGTSYPVTKGSGYAFSEGLSHETVHTGSEPRLLLGPMSETGLAVGIGQGLYLNPGQTGYIREVEGVLQYSADDQVTWTVIDRGVPFVLYNQNPSGGRIYITFLTNITIDSVNTYFICFTDNIQIGSTSLQSGGTRPIIYVAAANYDGFLSNGDVDAVGHNDIYVYNLIVDGTVGGGSLQVGAGWLCKKGFGNASLGNYIVNCASLGDTSGGGCGAIVGSYAGKGNGTVYSALLTIDGCNSSGIINDSDGGIVGQYAGTNGGNVQCITCWSTGAIRTNAGGIFGLYAGAVLSDGGRAGALFCYSTGEIDSFGGGIFGNQAASGTGTTINPYAIADTCYSQGVINDYAGGIFGKLAGYNGGSTFATNCYSSGAIGGQSGGIYGLEYASSATSSYCYTSGSCYGGAVGGIYSDSNEDNPAGLGTSNYSEAANGNSGIWTLAHAQATLQGTPVPPNRAFIGWTVGVIGQPYEITNLGYTPYSLEVIDSSSSLEQVYGQAINPGESTIPAIVSGKSYEIIEVIANDIPPPYDTITVDPDTGVISTTSTTPPGYYVLIMRNTGSYYISGFYLTVNAPYVPSSSNLVIIPPCCQPICPQFNQTTNNTQEEQAVRQTGVAIASDVDSTYAAINQNKPVQFLQPAFKTYRDYMNYLQSKYR